MKGAAVCPLLKEVKKEACGFSLIMAAGTHGSLHSGKNLTDCLTTTCPSSFCLSSLLCSWS